MGAAALPVIGAVAAGVGLLAKLAFSKSGTEKASQAQSYDVDKASADDAWHMNDILEQDRKRREPEFDKFDQHMQKHGRLVIEEVKKDIKGFERYGLEIDEAVIEQPFAAIENETTPLKALVDRRYIQTDPGMKAILKLEEGPEKKAAGCRNLATKLCRKVAKNTTTSLAITAQRCFRWLAVS